MNVSQILSMTKLGFKAFALWPTYGYDFPRYLVSRIMTSLTSKGVQELRLHDGTVLFSLPNRSLLDLFDEIWIKRVYNPEGFEIKENDIVVDVGANAGVFTAYAAKRTSARVLAIEPMQDSCDLLARMIRTNRFSNVTVHQKAIWEKQGLLSIYTGDICPSAVRAAGHPGPCVQAECTTIDDAISEVSRVDFLKMDVEGAEFEIFDSMSIETAEKIQKMSLEYHAWGGRDIQHLIRRLRDLGFHVTISPEGEKHEVGIIWASKTQSQ